MNHAPTPTTRRPPRLVVGVAPSAPLPAAVLLASSLFATTLLGATRVELVLDEVRPFRSVAWPVTTGVPFPQGALVDARRCRLVDDRGAERPLQAKVAATWDAARSSVRWLTIDFIAEPGRTYALEFGPDVARRACPPTLAVVDGDDVVVRTGPAEVEFSRRGPSALGSVRLDLDADGRFAPEERVASGPTDGDRRFREVSGVVSDNARDGVERSVVVETAGPVRVCVRVDGWYTAPDGRRTVAYRTRYHLFAGLSLVKLVDEFRIVGSTRDVKFRDIGLPLALHVGDGRRSIAVAGRTLDAAADETVSSVQETYRHYGNPECRGYVVAQTSAGERLVEQAERVGSWMQVVGNRAAVTGSLRNFWQQFPKQWEASADRLTLHLWSPRTPPLDFGEAGLRDFFGPAGSKYLLEWTAGGGSSPITDFFFYAGRHALRRDGADGRGIRKHHEAWYHFGPAGAAADGRQYGALVDRPPLCLASGAWNVGTGVFGPLAAKPNDSPYEAIVDRVFDLERRAQDAFGDYGWFLFGAGPHYSYQWDPAAGRHYADPRRFEYHTYQRETQWWWSYFRSGERKYRDWCLPAEDHWTDIAVSHVPLTYSTRWRGGTAEDATLHYPAGDWSIDSPLHYVRHHDTGEAWLRGAAQFWGTYHRTLETTTLAYYLTDDARYQDVVEFWKAYWGALAGVRSDSTDVPPWHRDQSWFLPTAPGRPAKSWAEMLRDYAPFQSGSRHQMTLFFNLATLYEHTWDPTVRRVLDEYAAAFIRPENPNGVWQCQDHRLPANADSPLLAHYWSTALWKYARASADPRMPEVLRKYFTACLEADPYGADVGIYSNQQIAWAWHFTRDPRHLAAAREELTKWLPHAAPLDRPEDLGGRIYNPYAPIATSAAVPRLAGALEDAQARGVAIPPPPPLAPQRTLIAVAKRGAGPLRGALWGWDEHATLCDADGRPCARQSTVEQRSHRTPFDRATPGYRVFRTEFEVPAEAAGRWCYLSPTLETGIVELSGDGDVWCRADEPLQAPPRQAWHWIRPPGVDVLTFESARPTQLRIAHEGRTLSSRTEKNRSSTPLDDVPLGATLTIATVGGEAPWFRLVDLPDDACWVTPRRPDDPAPPPTPRALLARRRPVAPVPSVGPFVAGRFGRALRVEGKQAFELPDEIPLADGRMRRLSDQRRGSIEFRVRRLDDERLTPVPRITLLDAGSIRVDLPKHVPLGEWTHVAVDWFPLPGDDERSLVCVYVDGVDYGNYRSMYWAGYGDRPQIFSDAPPWRKRFAIAAPPGAAFELDDLRISARPRYVDASLPFGGTLTFNPGAFAPPTKPADFDEATLLLAPFDDSLEVRTLGDRTLTIGRRP